MIDRLRHRGFTFMELLAALGVIMLIAGMMLPVYVRSRESARRNSCRSNLQQLTQALHLYAQDNDGRFPPAEPVWPTATQPYAKSTGVWGCPSDPDRVRNATLASQSGSAGLSFHLSYRYQPGLSNDDWDDLPLVWDRAPFHRGWANVASLGGSIDSVPAAKLPCVQDLRGSSESGGKP